MFSDRNSCLAILQTRTDMVTFQPSIFGYRFRVDLQKKKGVQFVSNTPPKTASGLGLTFVIGGNKLGNKSKPVLVL